ncbi:MAG: hypothetical protein A2521_05845 [Deltaproteobacteria bacterium RIFOXYD12_FULL_57_12]|nr:MAG: hypothetical protein A2521_05845 [Deltaproteobacteria bacterium RIFOXYD12_FULL_57_12]
MLINKFGIRNDMVLERVAATVAGLRVEMLKSFQPLDGDFDLKHLRAIHRYLFQDVFPWAGQLRMVETVKGGQDFEAHTAIVPKARALFVQLREENFLQGLDLEPFIERLVYYYAELNRIHVFRDGNGRAQRTFFELLAARAEYHLDFAKATKRENNAASHAAYAGDFEPLRAMFRDIVFKSATVC